MVLLKTIKRTVNTKLGEEQEGFRGDRNCTAHIATLRIIVEQLVERQ